MAFLENTGLERLWGHIVHRLSLKADKEELKTKISFKKLSAVETVETVGDAANVLIEENGEIKKAPKSEVGGAGGIIIMVDSSDRNNITAPEDLYEQLKNIYETHAIIPIAIYEYNHYYERYVYCYIDWLERYGNGDGYTFRLRNANYSIDIHKDGRLECYYE